MAANRKLLTDKEILDRMKKRLKKQSIRIDRGWGLVDVMIGGLYMGSAPDPRMALSIALWEPGDETDARKDTTLVV